MTSSCSSCGAPIRWARTLRERHMPLDPEPHQEGTVQLAIVGGEEIAVVVKAEDRAAAQLDGIPLYRSHFATCPNASSHRRGRTPPRLPVPFAGNPQTPFGDAA